MCIICISPTKIKQPSDKTLKTMFLGNPHGAGYMYAREGQVHIRKGFMDIASFLEAVHEERFTKKDSVVYHFRISTQAGVNPAMTHPFPLSNRLQHMRLLRFDCRCGIAHNGTIRLTADPTNVRYSDTALFIAHHLSQIIRDPSDLQNFMLLDYIGRLAQSKLVMMDGDGYIATIGHFIEDSGLLYSNGSYQVTDLSRQGNRFCDKTAFR